MTISLSPLKETTLISFVFRLYFKMIAFLCISKRKKALRRSTLKKKQKTKTKGLYLCQNNNSNN